MESSGSDNVRLFKYVGLVSISIQTASLVLVMRYVRTRPGDKFISSSAVVLSEVCKIIASLITGLISEKGNILGFFRTLYTHILLRPKELLKVAVPSILYTAQNNLLFIAVSNLDAATFQVTYQLKILTTALLSVFVLNKQLSRLQWVSLVMLFVGVSIVQLQETVSNSASESETDKQNPLLGLIAVIASTVTSAFAGVYMEKILKGVQVSLWVRNTQVALVGMVIGYLTMYINDGSKIQEKGMLFGYDAAVWCVVFLHSFGGLMVALVMRYADNILKGFATSGSIIMSCIASMYFFDFILTLQFSIGTFLVIVSVYMYSKFIPEKVQPAEVKEH